MKILYGVCGDGMGHAMRSAVVGRHLEALGHSLTFVSYGGALAYLNRRWPNRTISIVGLEASIAGNKVSALDTLLDNVRRQKGALLEHLLSFAYASVVEPDVVISDFETWTAHYAWLKSLPLIAVDNIHFINHCSHPKEVSSAAPGDRDAARLFDPFAGSLVGNANRYFVTTFAGVPVCKPNTTLHFPILRDEVLRMKGAPAANHVVSYFNSKADHAAICSTLERASVPVRAYGKPDQNAPATFGNLTICPFSDEAFIRDVATSRAVIGGAGFTFMTEAIYLGKPMLAVPYGAQYEQILNANYLSALGYGERCDELTQKVLVGFLGQLPAYERNLSQFVHDGNAGLLGGLDAELERIARDVQ